MFFSYFTLFVALVISIVAEFYSIVGLMAIFAAAPIPVAIMGAALGVGKITAAVWLKLNWDRARWTYKLYLIPAVAALMFLTSMGIFGFLSKAHSDQSLVSGDVIAKLEIIDERIKTEKENIDAARKALTQMDSQVNERLSRSTDDRGAERAVQIRRQQQAERARLQKDIVTAQNNISRLNNEAAPIRAEVRKVEAEVGPIKYIAAMIYGDNPDANLLESAVRWVIILIVAVFDPLALVLILSAQQGLRWAKEDKLQAVEGDLQDEQGDVSANQVVENNDEPQAPPAETAEVVIEESKKEPSIFEQHPYLNKPFVHFTGLKPVVYKPEKEKTKDIEPEPSNEISEIVDNTLYNKVEETTEKPDVPYVPYYVVKEGGYIEVEGKNMHRSVVKDLYPSVHEDIERRKQELGLKAQADNIPIGAKPSRATFGVEFPKSPEKGEMFLHVASLPTKLYKYNGQRWIEVDKTIADSYTYNEDYLQYLSNRIGSGSLSKEDLTEREQEQLVEYLNQQIKNV